MNSFKKNLPILLITAITLFFQGCFSSSMMSTAKTLDKSEHQLSVGVSGYAVEFSQLGIAPDLLYRRGINEKLDFGIGYAMGLAGHIRGDIKYELLTWNNNNSFLSTGIGLDVYLPDDFGGQKMVGSTIPLYLSFNHDKSVVPYIGQRLTFGWNGLNTYKYLSREEPVKESVYISNDIYYSGAFGLRFGENKKKFFIELSYSYWHSTKFNAWQNTYNSNQWENSLDFDKGLNIQISLGYTFGLKNKKNKR